MVNKAEKKVRKEFAKQVIIAAWDTIKDKEDVRSRLLQHANECDMPEVFECLLNELDLQDVLRSAREEIRKRSRAHARRSKTSPARGEATLDQANLPPSPPSTSDAEGQTDSGLSTSGTAAQAEKPIYDDAEAPDVMISIYNNDVSKWEVLNGCYIAREHSYISVHVVNRYRLKVDAPGQKTVTLTWREHGIKYSKYPSTKFTIVADDDIVRDIIISNSWDEEPISDGEGSKCEESSQQRSEEETSNSESSDLEDEEDDPREEGEDIESHIGVEEEDEEVEKLSNGPSTSETISPEQSEAEADTSICRLAASTNSQTAADDGSLEFMTGMIWNLNRRRIQSEQQASGIKKQKDLASPPATSRKPSHSTLQKTSIQFRPSISETPKARGPSSKKSGLPKSSPGWKQMLPLKSDSTVIPAISKVRRRSSSGQSAGGIDAPSKPKRRPKLENIQSDAESSRGETSKLKSRKPQKPSQERLTSEKKTRPRSPMATSSSKSTKTRRAKSGSSEYG